MDPPLETPRFVGGWMHGSMSLTPGRSHCREHESSIRDPQVWGGGLDAWVYVPDSRTAVTVGLSGSPFPSVQAGKPGPGV